MTFLQVFTTVPVLFKDYQNFLAGQILATMQMLSQGWDRKPGVKIVHGRWQDSLDQLEQYDGIFFDTYSEFYEDLRCVHTAKACSQIKWKINSTTEQVLVAQALSLYGPFPLQAFPQNNKHLLWQP